MQTIPNISPAGRRGFSLVELLVVVAIIMVLTGLLAPAIRKMLSQSGRGKAAAQTVAVANAIKSYRNVFGTWPGQTQGANDNVVAASVILNALTNNSRSVSFLEPKDNWIKDGVLIDQWRQPLKIAMDENGDGQVSIAAGAWAPFPATNVASATVLVLSWGPEPNNPESWVMSWIR